MRNKSWGSDCWILNCVEISVFYKIFLQDRGLKTRFFKAALKQGQIWQVFFFFLIIVDQDQVFFYLRSYLFYELLDYKFICDLQYVIGEIDLTAVLVLFFMHLFFSCRKVHHYHKQNHRLCCKVTKPFI